MMLDTLSGRTVMNLFFEGSLKAMPPKLLAENGRITVIRPLLYTPESMLADFARERGAPALEGYPSPDPSGTLPAPFLYTGTVSLFERAGFAMAARRGKGRAVMRLDL